LVPIFGLTKHDDTHSLHLSKEGKILRNNQHVQMWISWHYGQ